MSERSDVKVKFAVWGGRANNDENRDYAKDIKDRLQELIDSNHAIVTFTKDNFEPDPAFGAPKHFGGIIIREGIEYPFACGENETINFFAGGGPQPSKKIHKELDNSLLEENVNLKKILIEALLEIENLKK